MARSATRGWSGSWRFVAEGGIEAFLEFQLLFEGMDFMIKARDCGCTWPDAWTWMCGALSIME